MKNTTPKKKTSYASFRWPDGKHCSTRIPADLQVRWQAQCPRGTRGAVLLAGLERYIKAVLAKHRIATADGIFSPSGGLSMALALEHKSRQWLISEIITAYLDHHATKGYRETIL